MQKIILAPEVYLAGTMSGGGPAAQFFQLALSKRDEYAFLVSKWLLNELVQKMIQAGYAQAQAEDQAKFIAGLFTKSASEATSLSTFAESESLDRVYVVGADSGKTIDGVAFLPVSELNKELA